MVLRRINLFDSAKAIHAKAKAAISELSAYSQLNAIIPTHRHKSVAFRRFPHDDGATWTRCLNMSIYNRGPWDPADAITLLSTMEISYSQSAAAMPKSTLNIVGAIGGEGEALSPKHWPQLFGGRTADRKDEVERDVSWERPCVAMRANTDAGAARRPDQTRCDYALGGTEIDNINNEPCLKSSREDEEKIYMILTLFDTVMDRCEETAQKTSRKISCLSPTGLSYESGCQGQDDRNANSENTSQPLGERKRMHMDLHSFPSSADDDNPGSVDLGDCAARAEGAVYDVLVPEDESDTDESIHLEDGDSDEDYVEECEDETSYATNLQSPAAPAGIAVRTPSMKALLELLFGLSMAFCTQSYTDGQLDTTALFYSSGILGFSAESNAFLPARSLSEYPVKAHRQGHARLLYLEYALPLEEYVILGIPCRPRTKYLQRLDLVRVKYMVSGAQSPFEEMMSLRDYGRVMARTDTPPFLLRWSEDSQIVFHGDVLRLSMGDFRHLPEHLI
ncbi:hypothetical protein QQS21_005651 [Conoideocrella luteorostrata]|uniref:Uncharacterized protein n=1 Tax=Conoideocrella luteorostrata TaxID=1105319 RepID=A0AAJ0FU97_9HYPO|nr:hypothetical protein QQS21_005651 [Conoideocrella luteorostrata]